MQKTHEGNDGVYLRLSGRGMGLLLDFNTDLIERGLHRMLNG